MCSIHCWLLHVFRHLVIFTLALILLFTNIVFYLHTHGAGVNRVKPNGTIHWVEDSKEKKI